MFDIKFDTGTKACVRSVKKVLNHVITVQPTKFPEDKINYVQQPGMDNGPGIIGMDNWSQSSGRVNSHVTI